MNYYWILWWNLLICNVITIKYRKYWINSYNSEFTIEINYVLLNLLLLFWINPWDESSAFKLLTNEFQNSYFFSTEWTLIIF